MTTWITIHMLFNKDEGLPVHYSNSNVYMTVLQGTLTIGLNDQEDHHYTGGIHCCRFLIKSK
jgi:quercetin dioxygenase-like cupin family protein